MQALNQGGKRWPAGLTSNYLIDVWRSECPVLTNLSAIIQCGVAAGSYTQRTSVVHATASASLRRRPMKMLARKASRKATVQISSVQLS